MVMRPLYTQMIPVTMGLMMTLYSIQLRWKLFCDEDHVVMCASGKGAKCAISGLSVMDSNI